MIRATFDTPTLTAADSPAGSRTISGVAVPYGMPGRVADGQVVIFEPGSLDAAARPVALRDHDRGRPIGRVVEATDWGNRVEAAVRVSRTRDGDEALVLAADDVLGAFSVGVEPTDWYHDDDGTLHVVAGDWQELSLLTIGAYAGARVATVTATQPEGGPMTAIDPVLELTPEEPDDDDQDDDEPTPLIPDVEPDQPVETRAPALPVTAAGGRRQPARDALTVRALGPMIHAARAGNRAARQQVAATLGRFTVEAALADITMVGTNNVGSMYRPAYQAEIVEIVSHGAPLTEVLRQGDLTNGDFPNKTFVQWTTRPQVALQTAEKAEIASGPAALGIVAVPVQTWATGNDISRQTLDLGPPSFVEEWVRAASVDYAQTIETYAETALLAAAAPVATVVGDSFAAIVAKLFAALNPALVPAGRLFLAVSYDAAAGLIPVTQQNGPAYWTVNLNLGTYMPGATDVGGLTMIICPTFPARTYLLGLTNAATWYDAPGVPYTLQAVNVGRLGLDIAIYGYGALGVQYTGALVKTTQPAA